jgi:polysaccharide export outer membrane protein
LYTYTRAPVPLLHLELSPAAGDGKLKSGNPSARFASVLVTGEVPCTSVGGTFHVLFTSPFNATFVPSSSDARAESFAVQSNGVSTEMNVAVRCVVLVAAGLLILRPAVVASAQEIAPSPAPASGSSASPPGNSAAESSQSPNPGNAGSTLRGAITQPGKADGMGDPALGGERHPLYRLSKSDVVDVNFTFSPDFNQTLTIQPDGFVALKGAGSIFAEGLTLPQLQQAVAGAYRGFLHQPEITLTLKDFDRPYFLASGEVARPGKYELRGDLTVNEAIASAGADVCLVDVNAAGLEETAREVRALGVRAEAHVLDIKKMLGARNLREDLHLRPGDFIFVPQNRISKVRKFVPTNSLSWYLNPLQF